MTNRLISLKLAFSIKKVKLNVVCGSEAVAAVGDGMGGCEDSEVDAGGVTGARAVAEVAVVTGVGVAAFFADFFLLEGAGIVFGLNLDGNVQWGSKVVLTVSKRVV